jgi:hypothetical protein
MRAWFASGAARRVALALLGGGVAAAGAFRASALHPATAAGAWPTLLACLAFIVVGLVVCAFRSGWRWPGVTSRAIAGIAGGYAVGALVSLACAVLLPMAPSEAVVTGMMLSFLAYAGVVLWVFAARNAWRAWAGVVLPSVLLAAASWLGRAA